MAKKHVLAVWMSFHFRYRFKESKEAETWDYNGNIQCAVTIEDALKKFYEYTSTQKNHGYIEIENIEAEPVYREANFY